MIKSNHHPEQISHHNLRSQNYKPSIKEGQKQDHYITMMEYVLHLLISWEKEKHNCHKMTKCKKDKKKSQACKGDKNSMFVKSKH